MVKSPLRVQIPAEFTQPCDCRGIGIRRTWLSNFLLTSPISSWRKPRLLLHFLGGKSDTVTLVEHLWPGCCGLWLLSTLLQQERVHRPQILPEKWGTRQKSQQPHLQNIPTGQGTQDQSPTYPSLGIGQGGQAGNAANEGISAHQCLSSPNE